MTTDEDRARRLIAVLRDRTLANDGRLEYVARTDVPPALSCTEAEATGALIFAEAQGWVLPFRTGAKGLIGATLSKKGFAEAGRTGSEPRGATIVQNTYHGDVIGGNKTEIRGDHNAVDQASKATTKSHVGDTTTSTSFWVKLGKLFGLN